MLARRATLALFACASCGSEDPESEALLRYGPWTEALDASQAGWMMSTWGPDETTQYVVGGAPAAGVIFRSAGGSWAPMSIPDDTPIINWVHGTSPEHVWAVGDGGTILRLEGGEWRRVPSPTTQNLWGVFAVTPGDVWAVGGGTTPPTVDAEPTVLRWDGAAWSVVSVPALEPAAASQLFKVWASGPADVYIVGALGVILNWDGEELRQVLERPVDHAQDYISLWGTGPDHVVVVGGRNAPQIAFFDGSTWHPLMLDRGVPLNGVWMGEPSCSTLEVQGAWSQPRASCRRAPRPS
ncbi:MAG: hypothetical protein HC923_05965 [Myxococcales bacterium]|nr:hypothetical protein [Myxococcales bacterium]